jgi:hypothetical protein
MSLNGKENDLRKVVMTIAIMLIGLFVSLTSGTAGPAQASADQVGFELLDRLVVLLAKSVAPGGSVDLEQNILLLAKDLKLAREAKRVDDLFAVRYSRLLSAVRQSVLRDPELLYWPMYRFHMIDFIEERTGRMPDWDKLLFIVNDHGGSGVGLAILSEAIMSEVVSLHIHLENLARRPEILKTYMEKSMKGNREGK